MATPRKTATRKAVTSKPADSESVDNSAPLAFQSAEKDEEELVTLFTIDDEDYTVPKNLSPNTTYKFLNELRKGNDTFTVMAACEAVLGAEQWEKFLNWDGLTDDIMEQVTARITTKIMGEIEDASGK